jgi:hypothetical protein
MAKIPIGCSALAVALALTTSGAWCAETEAEDPVLVSIEEATEFYRGGNYSEAVSSLNLAVQQIQEKKGSTLAGLLPEPLEGWIADAAKSEVAAAAMLGGGLTVERTYRKDQASVQIQIVSDSPMLQAMMMMFANPMFASADGGRMERFGRQKAIVKFDPATGRGSINAVVANRFLIALDSRGASEDELRAYAAAVDFDKIAALP